MQLNIEWNSKVEVFDAVGTIETYSDKRNDIIEVLKYIQGNGFDKSGLINIFGNKDISPVIVERVLEYLRECGYVINENISTKGREILKTGKVPVEQRGKFRFWNIEDLGPMKDMYHSGSKLIIGYRREKDSKNKLIHRENPNIYNMLKVTMPNTNEEFKVLSLSEKNYGNDFACTKQSNLNKNIKLNLELDSSNVINLSVNGKLNDFGADITVNNNTVFSDKVIDKELTHYIINILNQCDIFNEYSSKKCSFKLNNIEILMESGTININDLESFRANIKLSDLTIGESVYDLNANNIPIIPGTKEDAIFWFDKIIERRVSNKYMSSEEFKELIEEISNKEQFKEYINTNGNEIALYINRFKKGRLFRQYWNLKAPIDLQFNSNIKELIMDKIDISIGEKISIEQLVSRLVGNNKVDKLIFSSRYVRGDEHIRKFQLFMESLRAKGCYKFNLVTEYGINGMNCTVDSYEKVYGSKKNWPHDRYFSLKIDKEWYYYKMSAELDQCKYDKKDLNEWSCTTIGNWKDVSFYRIEKSIFPLELLKLGEEK